MTEIEAVDDTLLLKLSAARATRRLADAPGIVAWIRHQATPTMGGAQDGMPRPATKEAPAPIRIDAVDTSDEIVAQLVNWVAYWAELYEEPSPLPAGHVWTNTREIQGFRAGIEPATAGDVVDVLARWLTDHHNRIMLHSQATAYFDDIAQIIQTARGRFPRAPRTQPAVHARQCPICGCFTIGAWWMSSDVRDVVVMCSRCDYVINAKTLSRKLDWIE